jgi:hypothetical protein
MPAVAIAMRQNMRLDHSVRRRSHTNPWIAASVRQDAAVAVQIIVTQFMGGV